MQTTSVPYRCSEEGVKLIAELRRIYSAAVRTAYANGMGKNGKLVLEKDLRHLVKGRFAGGVADAWLLHCATLEGREMRKRVPEGTLVFGGRKHLLRRNDGLIDSKAWQQKRLLPLASRGDKTFMGNRHFRLSADGSTCRMAVYGRVVELSLSRMTGNAGEILRGCPRSHWQPAHRTRPQRGRCQAARSRNHVLCPARARTAVSATTSCSASKP